MVRHRRFDFLFLIYTTFFLKTTHIFMRKCLSIIPIFITGILENSLESLSFSKVIWYHEMKIPDLIYPFPVTGKTYAKD